jgi:hypothetical protein
MDSPGKPPEKPDKIPATLEELERLSKKWPKKKPEKK